MRVLDIDMDYFMDVVAHTGFSEKERLSDDCYVNSVWSEDRVRDFLENNLGLSQENKIKGRIVNGHNESLFFWEEQIDSANLQIPFQVVHVDSHADLGLGVAGVSEFLQEGILLLDPEVRRKIRSFEFNGKIQEITIGDYLLWAIAYRYISEIDYCANPHGEKDDYCWDTLKDFKENYIFDKPVTNYIQLKYNPRMDLPNYSDDEYIQRKYLEECTLFEPEVSLNIYPQITDVSYDGKFDYVTFAISPNYTPQNADFIIEIIKEYIDQI